MMLSSHPCLANDTERLSPFAIRLLFISHLRMIDFSSVKILFFLSVSCIPNRVHSCMHVILLIRKVSLRWCLPVFLIRPVSNTAFPLAMC